MAAEHSTPVIAVQQVARFHPVGGLGRRPLTEYFLAVSPYITAPPMTGPAIWSCTYGAAYVDALCAHARTLGVSLRDTLSTATRFTAECIREGVERFCPQRPERLIVGGGGSMNPVLLAHIADCLPGCQVLTNEQLGLDSSAKEAVAFAVLANEALYGCANNAPGATGAAHGVVMGKISL